MESGELRRVQQMNTPKYDSTQSITTRIKPSHKCNPWKRKLAAGFQQPIGWRTLLGGGANYLLARSPYSWLARFPPGSNYGPQTSGASVRHTLQSHGGEKWAAQASCSWAHQRRHRLVLKSRVCLAAKSRRRRKSLIVRAYH